MLDIIERSIVALVSANAKTFIVIVVWRCVIALWKWRSRPPSTRISDERSSLLAWTSGTHLLSAEQLDLVFLQFLTSDKLVQRHRGSKKLDAIRAFSPRRTDTALFPTWTRVSGDRELLVVSSVFLFYSQRIIFLFIYFISCYMVQSLWSSAVT